MKKFAQELGNPPYQFKKNAEKRGKSGDNSLYIKFILKSVELLEDGGILSLVTPPAALIKSTTYNEPTETLAYLMNRGSLESIDLNAKKHFSVGTAICGWRYIKGKKQGNVILKKDDKEYVLSPKDIYYIPPYFEDVEFNLYNKIINNTVGDTLEIRRSDGKGGNPKDWCMARFGYPKVEPVAKSDNPGALKFDAKFAPFLTSQLGLWLLDYVRRHDQMIYHKLLTGIRIPKNGFTLTKAEQKFIDSKEWRNFGVG